MDTASFILLPDGRHLAFSTTGDPSSTPVVFLHGAPGSRLLGDLNALAQRCQAYIIAPDRPGYGKSDPTHASSVLAYITDLIALVDALSLHTFHVAGISAGCASALAACFAIPNRVRSATLIAGIVPTDTSPCTTRHSSLELTIASACLAVPITRALVDRRLRSFIARPEAFINTLAPGLSTWDRQWLSDRADPIVKARFLTHTLEGFRQGSAGLRGDLPQLCKGWGFAPEAVSTSVTIWHGTADRIVPPRNAEALARKLPACKLQLLDGVGHFVLLDETLLEAVLHDTVRTQPD
ncbi:alpha/beta fold hydrolase [Thauera sp. Sel9]|uniref:alpha/beta fold hydrolase n=1 Tax=Thauera sp. Sel9 TaxID=2974299 RepID=UPI0021E1579D|nr:alpha/beta hydrolase [Thauera sp. Sel9]MCV2217268.1 alpha/beta hydrolase [Thauera sp. Sel9]